jgi:uncharacterized RDD family membrane protein YckC
MSDVSGGPGWWQASDGRWYPPEQHPSYAPPPPPPTSPPPPPPGPPGSPGQPGGPPPPPYPSAPGAAPAPTNGYMQPGVAAHGMYLDQQSGLMLPNGVQLASSGRRIGAYFLAIPLAIVTLFIGYIIWGVIIWGRGQTPTYQVLRMRCWRPEEQRVAGWGWMALREIVGGIADSILSFITQIISLILMLTSPKRQALHDLIGGTVVLHDPNNVLQQ